MIVLIFFGFYHLIKPKHLALRISSMNSSSKEPYIDTNVWLLLIPRPGKNAKFPGNQKMSLRNFPRKQTSFVSTIPVLLFQN